MGRPAAGDQPDEPDDRGETLVETLITIVVMGLTIPAIMGAIMLSVGVSDQHRKEVQAQALLASWAATITRETTDARYPACPTPAVYASAPFAPAAVPAGFTTRVIAIDYWVKAVGTGQGSYSPACSADAGLRRVRLAVDVPDTLFSGFSVTQTIVVRRPCDAC